MQTEYNREQFQVEESLSQLQRVGDGHHEQSEPRTWRDMENTWSVQCFQSAEQVKEMKRAERQGETKYTLEGWFFLC